MASQELTQENKDHKHARLIPRAVRGVTAGAVILSTFLAPAFLNNSPLENSQTAFADWNDNNNWRRHRSHNNNGDNDNDSRKVEDWERDRNHNGIGDQWDGRRGRERCEDKNGRIGFRQDEDWDWQMVCAINIVDIPDNNRRDNFRARWYCKNIGMSYVRGVDGLGSVCAGTVKEIG